MKCARCDFENIPGQDRCLKCGSILEVAGAVVEVHPPRMSAWKRPMRGILRWVRRRRAVPAEIPTGFIREKLGRIATDGLVGLVVGIIPGLAHVAKGRFREIRLILLLWAALLFLGLFLYGSGLGFVCIGLAIGLHAWIAIQFGLFKEIAGFIEKIVVVVTVVVVLTVLYWAIPRILLHGYTGGHTSLTIPQLNISAGDYLLVRRTPRLRQFPRGTLVLIRPERFRNARTHMGLGGQDWTVGQVVGCPEERIGIANTRFVVEGHELDPARFPVPQWLQGRVTRVSVPTDSYFVTTEYTVRRRGRATLSDQMIADACLMGTEDIRGEAFMRWWPLLRRGFIE